MVIGQINAAILYLLSQIIIYPVKGLAGISLQESTLCKTGFLYDRNWMLVDEKFQFISQRSHAKLALIRPTIIGSRIYLTYKQSSISFEVNEQIDRSFKVNVWEDLPIAFTVSHPINKWFSDILKQPVQLVKLKPETRFLSDMYSSILREVAFSDAFPFLLISEASLQFLNQKLETPVPMNRFRPNLVMSGGEPHDEDNFKQFSIGEISFVGAKPCARCVVTTINQETATQGKEPLKTLATYRTQNNAILFGMNVFSLNKNGTIRLGDPLVPLK